MRCQLTEERMDAKFTEWMISVSDSLVVLIMIVIVDAVDTLSLSLYVDVYQLQKILCALASLNLLSLPLFQPDYHQLNQQLRTCT